MSRRKIGIVEDEMVIADNIALALRKIGYEVCFVAFEKNAMI